MSKALPAETAGLEKGLFLGRGAAPQHPVTVREAAETPDNIGVLVGEFQIVGLAGGAKQCAAALLIGKVFRMHQRHIDELLHLLFDPLIDAARDSPDREVASEA